MKVFITGGAGFIGTNAAEHYLKNGDEVVLFDNLSRNGSEANLQYLRDSFGNNFEFVKGDIRDASDIELALEYSSNVDRILHLAAQVAVTTSVVDPRRDFEDNEFGTFNVVEAVRKYKDKFDINPVLIYASTNKVYGKMEDVGVVEKDRRWSFENLPCGVSETRNLDFHSPYGCSKGAADQRVMDAARIYGLDTIVMRQSCIYGQRQFGVEDQGWLAWFTIAQALGKQITVFGDGKQVRDVLWVNDLVNAYDLVAQNIDVTRGQVYNIGGGWKNTLSLLESFGLLETYANKKIPLNFEDWRPGDQKVCIMDITKAKRDFGWEPKVNPSEGMLRLYRWVQRNRDEIVKYFPSKD